MRITLKKGSEFGVKGYSADFRTLLFEFLVIGLVLLEIFKLSGLRNMDDAEIEGNVDKLEKKGFF